VDFIKQLCILLLFPMFVQTLLYQRLIQNKRDKIVLLVVGIAFALNIFGVF